MRHSVHHCTQIESTGTYEQYQSSSSTISSRSLWWSKQHCCNKSQQEPDPHDQCPRVAPVKHVEVVCDDCGLASSSRLRPVTQSGDSLLRHAGQHLPKDIFLQR